MVQINWTTQALDDLKDIAEYIKKDSAHYAKLQVIRLKTHVEVLKKQKYIGKIVPEIGRKDIRQISLGNYRIIYKITSVERVDILTIQHSSRNRLSRKDF